MKRMIFLLAALTGLHTTAQNSGTLPTDSVEQTVSLGNVVVTAQQREQQLLDVPAAISSVGSALLENTHTTTMEQLAAFVPGLNVNVQTPHRPSLSIRGLTSDEVSPTAQPRVSVYYNGVPTSRASMALAELYDMDRIEVLKGPQGTLFGRGAQIGAISLVTKKPVSAFGGYVAAGLGNYAAKETEAAINLPLISNKLMLRVAGIYSAHDGYVTNLSGGKLNGKNTVGGRLSATWLPSDKLSVGLVVNYQSDDNPGTAFMSKRYPNSKGETDIFKYEASLDAGKEWFNKRSVAGSSLTLKYAFSELYSLSSITSYYNNLVDHRWDGDGSVAPAIDMAEYLDASQFTQELRFSFRPNDRLEGFVGAGYWSEDVRQKYWFGPNEQYMAYLIFQMPEYMIGSDGVLGFPMPAIPADPQLGPLAGLPLPIDHEEESIDGARNRAADVFADFTYGILPQLKLTAGIRATYESFSTSREAYMLGSTPSMLGNLLGSAPNFFFAPTPYTEIQKSFWSGTYRANLLYEICSSSNVFAGYARGRRPNVLQFNSAGQSETMSSESVHSFDLGYKWSRPNSLWLDANLFYHLYNNFQTSKWDGANYLIADAGKATSYGLELSAKAALSDFLELFGNYAWIHARFDDTDSKGDPQEYAGKTFRLTPEHSFSIGLSAKARLSNSLRLSFTPTYSWKSHIWFEDANDLQPADPSLARLEQNAYGLLGANLALKYVPQNITLSVFAHNALGEQYLIGAGNTGMMFGVPTYVPGSPRMIGARLRWVFGS
ncbi:MAG: TonB-dependent receptor plug domain-containing protein [Tannerellaceae bacterium]|jgi:outer membrane receptor protein involved in Fe transport|nr:TonB-dependent receptor plug domain-containing protein [Tannerellaceae bacterium]